MDIIQEVKNLVKKHSHNGIDSVSVNASNVELESNSLKNIESNQVESALRDLDNAIIILQDKVHGGNDNKILIYKKGNIISTDLDISDIEKIGHVHPDFIRKIKGNKVGQLVQSSKTGLEYSGINSEDIKKLQDAFKVLYNIDSSGRGKIVVVDVDGSITNTDIKPENISKKGHDHPAYMHKLPNTEKYIPVTSKTGDLELSNIKLSWLNEIIQTLLKKISGRENDILLVGPEGRPKSSNKKLEDFSEIDHTHKLAEIEDFNIGKILERSPVFRDMVKEIIRQELKDIIKNI